ncbi:MAG: hypothetical protein KAU36_08615 [candidate division Zixibacteria bacterium]|nr:hypothetical protein [candidate division Zixibacteria bacterium]
MEAYPKNSIKSGRFYWWVGWGDAYVYLYSAAGVLNDQWHHAVCRRQGPTLMLWVDGTIHQTRTDPNYARNLFGSGWSSSAIGLVYGTSESDWPFTLADLRVYDRAITDAEIAAMSE